MIGKQVKQGLQKTEAAKKVLSDLHNEGGFTIVESLVAILVATILLAAIAPVLSLSVATRVQSRRVELATQAARAYIDAVRAGKVDPPKETISSATNNLSGNDAPTATGTLKCDPNDPPSTTSNPNPYPYCTVPTQSTSSLYCVDFDNNNKCETSSLTDMVVQAFRYNPDNNNTSNPAVSGYILGLRVYRADAFRNSATLLKNPDKTNSQNADKKNTTQNPFTGGVGQRTAPLVEMTADISDAVPKYSDLCARFKTSTSQCN